MLPPYSIFSCLSSGSWTLPSFKKGHILYLPIPIFSCLTVQRLSILVIPYITCHTPKHFGIQSVPFTASQLLLLIKDNHTVLGKACLIRGKNDGITDRNNHNHKSYFRKKS